MQGDKSGLYCPITLEYLNTFARKVKELDDSKCHSDKIKLAGFKKKVEKDWIVGKDIPNPDPRG